MPKYHILLGMPGPNIRFQLAQSAFCCVGKGHRVDVVGADSASWDNMNVLWATALNAARREGVTHYAQVHADIVPALDQDWINILLEEMESRKASFISAVVPIKDGRGVTSCGIADPTDPWFPMRRFTMHEVHSFPETFDQDDIGYRGWPLNHNSGMILADLRDPVFRKTEPDGELSIWFEFRKRMYIDANGEVKLVGESEDWNISRRLWKAGVKTCITRKPVLKHFGMTGYPSSYAWGEHIHDEGFRYKWQAFDPIGEVIANKPPEVLCEVRGWLADDERAELQRLATDRVVVEFGSYCGKSTIAMAHVARHVTAVDPFFGVPKHSRPDSGGQVTAYGQAQSLQDEFLENLRIHGVEQKVTTVVQTAETAIPAISFESVDFVFYDADHSYESTYRGGQMLFSRIANHCTVAFHDYGPGDPGVIRAVDQLSRETGRQFRVVNTLAIFDSLSS